LFHDFGKSLRFHTASAQSGLRSTATASIHVGAGRGKWCQRDNIPRCFFDIYDGGSARDNEGTELEVLAAVRQHVSRLLPDIAHDEVPDDDDRRTFSVVVTDEDSKSIYTATLN
jgi:hypothetical protein